MDLTTATLTRTDAVHTIARHLATRDVYLVAAGPAQLTGIGLALHGIPGTVCYADNGLGPILRTDRPEALALVAALLPAAAVTTVPKTVPASVLGEALGQHVPPDGSQDVVIVMDDAGHAVYPTLLVEAIDHVDPNVSALLRANDLAHLS